MEEIFLIFPPIWDVFSPYTSIPTLVAFLKSKNLKTRVWDANVELHDHIFSDEYLSNCLKNIEKCIESSTNIASKEFLLKKRSLALEMLGKVEKIKIEIQNTKADR